MPAFERKFEQDRIAELRAADVDYSSQLSTVTTNLRTYLLERNGAPSQFELHINRGRVQQAGYEHRGDGDLDASFQKSEEEATEDRVAQRYALETEGYGEVKKKFFELPIGSTILLMSPPPDEPIPGYPGHNNAYLYHILPDIGGDPEKRTIKALTWVNYFDLDEQAEILNDLESEEKVTPTEASILRHPVHAVGSVGNTDSFHLLWEKMGEVYRRRERPEDFRYVPFEIAEQHLLHGKELWEKQHRDLAIMTTNLAQRLISGESDEELATDWDIMLNLADKELFHVDVSHQLPETGFLMEESVMPGRVVFDAHRDLSYAPRITATACGVSAGLGTYEGSGSLFTSATFTVENTTGSYTGENAKNDPKLCRCKGEKAHFHCPGKSGNCKHAIIVGEGTTSCPKCGAGKTC